jgi:ubiquinone/menaquinone biosynthesis C-methylase UbiE
MSVQEEFDSWAESGRDRGMEDRHWHTAKHALARMPVGKDDRILDLGCGSGYALRALRETQGTSLSVGLDGSSEMVQNAREYTDEELIEYLTGDFHQLPFDDNSINHVWSMEAFYYAQEPIQVLEEIKRILKPGGTFYCLVNFFEESKHTHEWQENISIDMQLWNRGQYCSAFKEAGLYVAEQDTISDEEVDIPSEDEFPTEDWDSRDEMIDRYRTWGSLLTVGVCP